RLYSRPLLSGWFVQDQLFLQGSAQDWAGFVNVHLDYVAMPTGPVGLADTFAPAPDSVEATLVTYLANVMAKRGHNDPTLPAIDRQQFQGDHDAAFAQFLMEQGEKRKARRFKTLDVFPGGG
ncbi:MAG: hypothetical protein OER89_08940, partial [Gemmatimonadota bacterium]|nr:hypothetical protein [Gemmatimonadota bacterium]